LAILAKDSHSSRGRDTARRYKLRLAIHACEGMGICKIRSYGIVCHLQSERIMFDIEIERILIIRNLRNELLTRNV